MPNNSSAASNPREVHRLFQALADPTRCRVVEQLAAGPATTSALAEEFDMALPSFVQHLRVLSDTGLVTSTKNGRVRTYALNPDGLEVVDTWLNKRRTAWEQRLDQLDKLVLELNDRNQPKDHDRP